MEGLRADEARLPFRVLGAFLDRDRDGLLGNAPAPAADDDRSVAILLATQSTTFSSRRAILRARMLILEGLSRRYRWIEIYIADV